MIFIIAEIGVNWDGDFNLAKEMMMKAKEAGCNAVKFQAFEEKIVKDHPQRSRLLKSSIAENNIEIINELAKGVGIEWFCTPMYVEAVDLLGPFVKRYKIRERDGQQLIDNRLTNLLEQILKTNKEIIVSSQKSPLNSKYSNESRIKWLYCVPKYPCEIKDFDFSNINEFNGFSNHSDQIIVPLTAAILGAKIIEIHITSDKSKDFIDNNVSFNYSQLKEMIKLIRLTEKIKK